MSRTYKIFSEIDERFNLAPRSTKNIEAVCDVMTKCDFLNINELAHYAQISGSPEPLKDDKDAGRKYYSAEQFTAVYSKSNYLTALIDVLFIDTPVLYDLDKDGKMKLRNTVSIAGKEMKVSDVVAQIDREEVYAALGFFLSRFGETLHDHKSWLELSKVFHSVG